MPEEAIEISEVNDRAIVRLCAWGETLPPASVLVPPGLGGRVRLLALAPREWLVVSDLIDGPSLQSRLREHLEVQSTAAVDLSSGLKALRVEGPAARDLLSKGCGLDFHPNSFPAGRTVRTRFAQLFATLDCVDPTPRFDLYVARSYLRWLKSWLLDGALEFGVEPRSATGVT